MSSGTNILNALKKRWQLMLGLRILLYSIGPSILCFVLTSSFFSATLLFSALVVTGLAIFKPWRLTQEKVGNFIDQNFELAEYSSGLLLKPNNQLSGLAFLQRKKVEETLRQNKNLLKPDVSFKMSLLFLAFFMTLAVAAKQMNWATSLNGLVKIPEEKEEMRFQPLDSSIVKTDAPQLKQHKLFITYPSYTKKGTIETSNMNFKALEGSKVNWQLFFDQPLAGVVFESSMASYPMNFDDKQYTHGITLNASGFYNFRFKGIDGAFYQSDLFAMEVFEDESTEIDIRGLKQFTSFDFDEKKLIQFESTIRDDFGISEAYIVATVSKGEGESVKFREERLSFDNDLDKADNANTLFKQIDLDQLDMEAGDELYFYVTAVDNKEPRPNITRSETYFAVIKDTLSGQFGVEGTMGADLMPDYFRSQRQLIIDTENLIANKEILNEKDFNFNSNELGFDQKALRLKYGQFMGDEADSGIQVSHEVEHEEPSTDEDDANVLSKYTHDHDGSNEHNLVDHDHKEETIEGEKEDPLESYLHNHDDPEESTLFTQSLKSKLRQAMAEMWDAELYLRLYKPEESLPYQYRALKLIQDIKNSARIYVHRIGFDPPPIKENKRLTGNLDEINSFQKQQDLTVSGKGVFMKKAFQRLENIIRGSKIESDDRDIFAKAGNELAQIAIEEPAKHLNTLQRLKLITDSANSFPMNELRILQKGLLSAIPPPEPSPSKLSKSTNELNSLFLKKLEVND